MAKTPEAPQPNPTGDRSFLTEEDKRQLFDAVNGIRHGWIQVFIQDGLIVQVDRLEKRRISRVLKNPRDTKS